MTRGGGLTERAGRLLAGGIFVIACVSQDVAGQTPAATAEPIQVIVRWDGALGPGSVNGPQNDPFDKKGSQFIGSVPRPHSGVELYDLEVNFDGQAYPMRLRVHPLTDRVQIAVAMDRPRSCADVYLKRLEKPTLTQTSSIRAAFTLDYMIDGRAGENSCDVWPLRAAKARFDRYYNAMERSNFLVIPDGVKTALIAAAANDAERRRVDQMIAGADQAERQRLASALQQGVLAELKTGDVLAAYQNSALLSATAKLPDYSTAVSKQISAEALDKQTDDLGQRAGVLEPSAERSPQP